MIYSKASFPWLPSKLFEIFESLHNSIYHTNNNMQVRLINVKIGDRTFRRKKKSAQLHVLPVEFHENRPCVSRLLAGHTNKRHPGKSIVEIYRQSRNARPIFMRLSRYHLIIPKRLKPKELKIYYCNPNIFISKININKNFFNQKTWFIIRIVTCLKKNIKHFIKWMQLYFYFFQIIFFCSFFSMHV